MKNCKRWLASSLVFMVALCVAAQAWAGAPTEFVKERTAKVVKVLGKKESKKRRTELDTVMRDTIDFEELASKALGKHWKARSEDERKEFLNLLQQLLQANYTKKLGKKRLKDKNFKVKYQTEKTRKDKAIVKTSVTYEGEPKPVDYKLYKKDNGKWAAFDVVIDDISLLETYEESYVAIIEDEGWGELIKKMKAKLKEIENS